MGRLSSTPGLVQRAAVHHIFGLGESLGLKSGLLIVHVSCPRGVPWIVSRTETLHRRLGLGSHQGLLHPTEGRRVQVSVSWSMEDKPPLVMLDREY